MVDNNSQSLGAPSVPTGNTIEQRRAKRKISTTGLQYLKKEIERIKPNELSAANRLLTYELMLLDPDVATPYNKTKEMVETAFTKYQIKYNKKSDNSKKARKFIKDMIEGHFNPTTSPRGIASHAFTFNKCKLSLFEQTMTKMSGDWEGFYGLEGMSPIDLRTLDYANPFKIDDNGRKLSYARQNPNAFVDNLYPIKPLPTERKDGCIPINANRLVMFTESSDVINPFGISIFDNIYSEWRYKHLVKEILLTGVAKDLSGTPIFYVPQWLLEEAEEDPTGWQSTYIKDLDKQAAALHNGDQSFIRLPSDPHEGSNSMREFEVKFLG